MNKSYSSKKIMTFDYVHCRYKSSVYKIFETLELLKFYRYFDLNFEFRIYTI